MMIFLKTLLLSFVITLPGHSFGCTCIKQPKITKEDYNNAGAIFIGEIIGIETFKTDLDWRKEVTFKVVEHLKVSDETEEIKVSTNVSSGMCGLSVKTGEKWYVFAHYFNESLYASLCGRSLNLDKTFKVKDYGFKYSLLIKRNQKSKIKTYKREVKFVRKMSKKESTTSPSKI